VLRLLGEEDDAAHHGTLALEAADRLHNPWLAAKAQLTLGRLAARREEWADAEHLLHDALATIAERHCHLELPGAFEALAEVAAGLDSHTEAARILGAAERARRELGFVAWPAQRTALAALRARLGDALGPPDLEHALAEGRVLDRAEAVTWLRRARGARKRPRHGWESLTPTEVEVVRHAAAGLTNPEIGERLFVSPATVKTHLAHVYAKLGVRNRSQLAAEAAGRVPPAESRARSAI
jgi:DNA-binding CsgD family transcriptional regulator